MSDFIPSTLLPQIEDGSLAVLKRMASQNSMRAAVASLGLAARTATTSGSTISVQSSRGIALFLNITAASGTGGLNIGVSAIFPDGSSNQTLAFTPTVLTTVERAVLILYPGAGLFIRASGRTSASEYNVRVPGTIRPFIQHSDASSYTYSLEYQLLA
jgi:hypothetical protein